MEGLADGQSTIVAQLVGSKPGTACPTVQVHIDGQLDAVLSDPHPRSLPVAAGEHRVATRMSILRSRTLVVSLAPGERASLECGFHLARPSRRRSR